jgi:glutamyl-tRNA synthetase
MSDNQPQNRFKKVVTRFAPSPTGFMHVGGVRTALYAWAFAQKHEGIFILRIEDTDKEREVAGSIGHIIESLKWLGINWQEGPDIGGPHAPYIQSERLQSYRKYAHMLIEKGLAYADPYTQEELEAFRVQADTEKRPFLYRDHRPENPPAWIDKDGERKPLRLKITNPKTSVWNDIVRGGLSAGPEALDDFILIKSDGYPTYNFAHIIDDLEMGVTHIFRADEFISSTPKFLTLYDALGLTNTRPEFATLPPIMAPDGKKKLGKRDGAKDILAYRNEGYLPEAIVNFLAFIGWNPGDEREIMSPKEIAEAFDVSHVQVAGGKFNEEKLAWTNKEHLALLDNTEFESRLMTYMSEYVDQDTIKTLQTLLQAKHSAILPILRERLTYFGEIKHMLHEGELSFISNTPHWDTSSTELLICPEKIRKNGQGEKAHVDTVSTKQILQQVSNIMSSYSGSWNKDEIKDLLWSFAEHEGKGIVLWPTRVALSGKEKSPDPFTMMEILDKETVLSRLQNAIIYL